MRTINGKTKPKPPADVRLSREINRAGPTLTSASYFTLASKLWKHKQLSGTKRDELLSRLRGRLV